ncbi:Zn-dependent protease with chaperone function [Beggiatoa alba B18LD]|uniref:Zn-dependent protease with chaperone function n=1 Tax=Beggiatoa alba B18LD TaxID=395493 RepID=I3CIC9_9GAMM|nr:M48 family metalloprotease [Beggiatoa alba]EIJ43372.1 Zn-dependent protease with chaperone function [Beggiatoa alba B18LD]
MEKAEFNALVERLTVFAKEYPQKYKLRVALLAGLGYAYVFLIIALLFLGLGALIYLAIVSHHAALFAKFIIGLFIVIVFVFQALWVRLPPPDGIPLKRQQVPALFDVLDDIRQQLKGPKIHQVLVDNRFNAGIMQRPRLGIFGWQKNYLLIGLPFMHALSPEQFTAVLAHEYGHLSGAHNKFGSWIYRIRQSWYRLMDVLAQNDSWGMVLFRRFFNWYIPFFSAYSFVLARANEYEADRASADVVGSRTTAEALINSSIQGQFLEEKFWKNLYKLADKKPTPPALYPLLPKALTQSYSQSALVSQWLEDELDIETGIEDTHPALKDRLAALGETAVIPKPVTETAADVLLKSHLAVLQTQFNQQWQENISEQWQARHLHLQESAQLLEILQAQEKQDPLQSRELWLLAQTTAEIEGDKQAFPLYKRLLNDAEFSTAAYYQVGRILLENQQEKGVTCIEKAVEQEPRWLIDGYGLIAQFFEKQQQKDKAVRYQQLAEERALLEQRAYAERQFVRQNEVLLAHHLTEEQIQALAEQFAQEPTIKRVYIGRKNVQYLPEHPLYVIGIKRTFGLRSASSDKQLRDKLINQLNIPSNFVLEILNSDFHLLAKRLRKIRTNLVYDKRSYAKGLSLPTQTVKTVTSSDATPTPTRAFRVHPVWLILLTLIGLFAGLVTIDNPYKNQITAYIESIVVPYLPFDAPQKTSNLPTLAVAKTPDEIIADFQLSYALPFDARFVQGGIIAVLQYSKLFLKEDLLQIRYDSKQLDEWRYLITYQVKQGNTSNIKSYQATLSTKAEEIDKNLSELTNVMVGVTRDFPAVLQLGSESYDFQLDNLFKDFDYEKIFTTMQTVEQQMLAGKASPANLLTISELWSWLAFFKSTQNNLQLSDEFATQATASYLLAQAFKASLPRDSYQRGLLLFALDYPAMALNAWQAQTVTDKREMSRMTQLQAFIRHETEILKKQPNDALNLYLLMRYYSKHGEGNVSHQYLLAFLENSEPSFLIGLEYAIAIGSVGIQRHFTPEYFRRLLEQQSALLQTFFGVPPSTLFDKMLALFKIASNEQPALSNIIEIQQQQLKKASALQKETAFFSADLLRKIIELDMQNAATKWLNLESNMLGRPDEAMRVYKVITTYYPDSPLAYSLQFSMTSEFPKINELFEKAYQAKLDRYGLYAVVATTSYLRQFWQYYPNLIAWLNKYRQQSITNARGLLSNIIFYQVFMYEPVIQRYFDNLKKIDPYNPDVWRLALVLNKKDSVIEEAHAVLGDSYAFFNLVGDYWASSEKNDTASALRFYEQALAASPSSFSAYNKVTELYIQNKTYEKAIALSKQFLTQDIEPLSRYSVINRMGKVQLLQKDYQGAYKSYLISAKDGGQAAALVGIAKASEQLKKANAETLYQQAVERYPQGFAVTELGLFYLRHQEVDKAVATFKKYLSYQEPCYFCSELIDYYQAEGKPEQAIDIAMRTKGKDKGKDSENTILSFLADYYRQKGLHQLEISLLKRLSSRMQGELKKDMPFYYAGQYIDALVKSGAPDVEERLADLIKTYKLVHFRMLELVGADLIKFGHYDLAFTVNKALHQSYNGSRAGGTSLVMLAIAWRFGSKHSEADKAFILESFKNLEDQDEWVGKKVRALLGDEPIESLTAYMTSDLRRNEIYYFLAGAAAADGQREKAIILLLLALELHATDNAEYLMAYGLLKQLIKWEEDI